MIGLGLGKVRNVVCLGAHPDDIEIGCGGTLLALSERGDCQLAALVLTGDARRNAETTAALQDFASSPRVVVGELPDGRLPAHWSEVKQRLEDFARAQPADLVLAPRLDDAHQDHRLVGELARTVWRDSLILHYEIPKWDGDMSAPSHFVPLHRDTALRKVQLLNRHFPSQLSRDWWDDELFLGLMRLRGMEARSPYAEAYFVSKAVLTVGAEGVSS